MSEPCSFCETVSGEVQVSRICKNACVLAFMDLHSANVAHTSLVVPKEIGKQSMPFLKSPS